MEPHHKQQQSLGAFTVERIERNGFYFFFFTSELLYGFGTGGNILLQGALEGKKQTQHSHLSVSASMTVTDFHRFVWAPSPGYTFSGLLPAVSCRGSPCAPSAPSVSGPHPGTRSF